MSRPGTPSAAFRRSALGAGTALVTLLAIGGLALGTLQESSNVFQVPGGATRQRVAECDQGQRAVSGGFLARLTETGPAMLALDSTRESRRGWRFRTTNRGLTGRAWAFAYCDPNGPTLRTRSAQSTFADNQRGSIEAQCDSGQEAVAGGFNLPDGSSNLVASRRTGERTWELTVVNATGAPQTYKALVYCDADQPGLETRRRTIRADENEQFGQVVTAKCHRGEELRSGGFRAQYFRMAEFSDIGIVHGSRRQGDRRWQVTAFAPIGDPSIRAFAYCD